MERTVWTDERIDDAMKAIEKNFDRLFMELRELRVDMRADMASLRDEIGAVRTSLSADIGAVRDELVAFQRQVTHIVAGFAIGLLGVVAAAVLTQL